MEVNRNHPYGKGFASQKIHTFLRYHETVRLMKAGL